MIHESIVKKLYMKLNIVDLDYQKYFINIIIEEFFLECSYKRSVFFAIKKYFF